MIVHSAMPGPQAAARGRYAISTYARGEFSADMAAALVEDLALAMPRSSPRGYFAAKPEVIDDMDWTVTARDAHSGRQCAFLGARWLNVDGGTIMLYTLLVDDAHQRGSVTFLVLRALFGLLARDQAPAFTRVILKTAHPRSYLAMENFENLPGAQFYPSRTRINPAPMRAAAMAIAARLHPQHRFDAQRGLIIDAAADAPFAFYRELPTSSDLALNHYFAEHVGLRHRMLCMLELASADTRHALFARFRIRPGPPSLRVVA